MQNHRWLTIIATIGIGLISAAIVLRLPAAAQAPAPFVDSTVVSSPDGDIPIVSPNTPNTVLYDQYNNAGIGHAGSQNFEGNSYDDFTADDFVVSDGVQWSINLIEAQGEYYNGDGPADSMNIFIYTEAITTPGALVAARTAISYTNLGGNFAMTLTNPIVLNPGKYWLSVQANLNLNPTQPPAPPRPWGQWGWINRTMTSILPATWHNPDGGFYKKNCDTWNLRTYCIGDPGAADQVFRLSGISRPVPQSLTCGSGAPGSWRLRNYLPVPVYGPGVAGDGAYAYIFGGASLQAGGDFTRTLRYNPYANIFTSLAPLPDARMMASAVYAPINNKVYVFGGEKVGTGQIFNTTFIYDIGSNNWSTGTPMPEARAFMSAGYYNGKIYLVGGYSTTDVHTAHSQTWEYDVAANSWRTRTAMPQPLGGGASTLVDGHLFVIGGRDGTTTARNQTYDYDIAHDAWYTRTNATYGVNVAGAAELAGKVWVFGGGAPSLSLAESSSAIEVKAPETFSTTLIFDPGTYSWTTGPNLNVARSYVGAAGVGNFAVAIGGWTGSGTSDVVEVTMNCPSAHFSAASYAAGENSGSIQIPVQLDQISPLTATVRVNSTDGTATAGKDYTAISSTLTFPPGVINRTFNMSILDDSLYEDNETVFFILSPKVNSNVGSPNPAMLTIGIDNDPTPPLVCAQQTANPWILRNLLPVQAYGPGVANDGAFAYVLGGFNVQSRQDITQTVRYDPRTNAWTSLAHMPESRTLASAVYAPTNNKLYVFGGENVGSGAILNTTLIYDIAHDTWSTGASLPGQRAFMSSGFYNGKIYLVGGYSTGDVHSARSQTWEYNVTANTWMTRTSMTQPLGGAASAVVNGHLYVIGGRDGNTAARNQTYDYDIAHDTWSARMNIPFGVNVPGVAVQNGKIWVFGGGTPFLASGFSSSNVNAYSPQTVGATQIYDPAANSWSARPGLNYPRSFTGGTGFGNFVMAFGGFNYKEYTGYPLKTPIGSVEVQLMCPSRYLPIIVNSGH